MIVRGNQQLRIIFSDNDTGAGALDLILLRASEKALHFLYGNGSDRHKRRHAVLRHLSDTHVFTRIAAAGGRHGAFRLRTASGNSIVRRRRCHTAAFRFFRFSGSTDRANRIRQSIHTVHHQTGHRAENQCRPDHIQYFSASARAAALLSAVASVSSLRLSAVSGTIARSLRTAVLSVSAPGITAAIRRASAVSVTSAAVPAVCAAVSAVCPAFVLRVMPVIISAAAVPGAVRGDIPPCPSQFRIDPVICRCVILSRVLMLCGLLTLCGLLILPAARHIIGPFILFSAAFLFIGGTGCTTVLVPFLHPVILRCF